MGRPKTKKPLAIKFDEELLAELDRFKDRLPYPTTRTALLESAVRQMLEREARVIELRRRK